MLRLFSLCVHSSTLGKEVKQESYLRARKVVKGEKGKHKNQKNEKERGEKKEEEIRKMKKKKGGTRERKAAERGNKK